MPTTKLSADDLARAKEMAAAGTSQAQIAKEFGVNPSQISRTLSGIAHGGANMIRELPMDQVGPDPEQPRKEFDEEGIADLARSIQEHGLIQPITVRHDPNGGFLIVAGERRWRAHLMLRAITIAARVVEMSGTDLRLAQIVENLQRADLTAIEEGRAYKAIIDETGWTVAELARRLGFKFPIKVSERISLLNLRSEYLSMVERGTLTQTQGFELSRLPPEGQDKLFRALRTGKAHTQSEMRQFAASYLEAERQPEMIEAPKPAPEDIAAVSRLEKKIDAALSILAEGFSENELVAARKVDPSKADQYAEKLKLAQTYLAQMERQLRRSAAQLEFAAAA
jgi:ParB family chromosome partitioning protein